MTLIDLHSHFVTPSYVDAARAAGHTHPDGMPGWPDWDPGRHLELMDACGIATSVLSISSPGTHFGDDAAARRLSREVNEAGAALHADQPERFGHLASLPLPDVDGALAEAAYALDELGSDGVTVETNAGGRYLGDPTFTPLWSELDSRGAVVFVHPTSPPHATALTAGRPRPMLEFVFDTARTYTDLVLSGTLARFPRIRWVATHGGGALPLLADRIELFRIAFGTGEGDPVAAQLQALWFDTAGTPFPHQVPTLERTLGVERLVYGSDFCWTPAPAVHAQVASLDSAPPAADGRSWRELTTANARRLLG
ncbi:amidohydrolase (plasmid) [Pseudonocardia sp. EC080610-09]|uniref:amidohydrolase family protein n=1 Tax=unclassified Pseudonocardia TaxID=2619320 RepID=UPI00070689AE|nr:MULTISPECIES: amidohydrolase family protein [unclassified Pseudonocardia]ALL79592.1 amidohydrolase [Pseudonocardia sp. EC080610-09]ALL85454.1 amidohydrolase [Pseudonocardia sp. EC080619-01]